MKLFPMLYFSELFNKQVATDKGKILGQLKDLFLLYGEIPTLTILAVEDKDSRKLIPLSFLKKINHTLTVAHDYEAVEQTESELSVAGNLLDRQVIDLKGDKVVRINDVIISESPNYYISGIDISFWGVLRRLGLLKPVINILRQLKITVLQEALSWGEIQNLELMQGKIQLKVKEEKLAKIRPEDLADYLQTTNIDNIKTFLSNLNLEKAAEVFASLTGAHQTELIRQFKAEMAARFVDLLDPDEAVDILLTVSEKRRQSILEFVSSEKKEELSHLLRHSSTPMGELMTTEYLVVNSNLTAKEIIDKIRLETSDFACLYAVYALNEKSQLVGVFSLHELLMQPPDNPVYKFMVANPVTLHLSTPADIALNRLIRYNLSALPVINNQKHVLGMVTLDDLSDYIKR